MFYLFNFMYSGTVKWFDPRKGYGFITDENGKDFFVHISALEKAGILNLQEGDLVSFNTYQAKNGKISACDLKVKQKNF
jgi:CspA family cold shock protein